MSQSFIHTCPLNPVKGQIAFSQPTGDGQRLIESEGRINWYVKNDGEPKVPRLAWTLYIFFSSVAFTSIPMVLPL